MRRTLSLSLACSLLGLALAAQAQVYRNVGPDGKVTFSDRPLSEQANPARPSGGAAPSSSANSSTNSPALPYELAQVARRYPVTLYASADCSPCNAARSFLQRRGIPFSERSISNAKDADALATLSGGDSSLPFVTIGGQKLSGFSAAQWGPYLDAAGYPEQSQLPANYRWAPATPLVAVQAPQATAPANSAQQNSEAPPAPTLAPSGANSSNPAGIRF